MNRTLYYLKNIVFKKKQINIVNKKLLINKKKTQPNQIQIRKIHYNNNNNNFPTEADTLFMCWLIAFGCIILEKDPNKK